MCARKRYCSGRGHVAGGTWDDGRGGKGKCGKRGPIDVSNYDVKAS